MIEGSWTRRARSAAAVTAGAVTAGAAVLAGQGPVPAVPTADLSRADCVSKAERKRITRGRASIFTDRNENGYIEAAAFDSDKDGNVNWMVYDQNEDGVAYYTSVDLIGSDGIADTWVPATSPTSYNPPNTSAQQAREANDMMVQHIVTMNQLRQFDPWSPAYVPDGLTPSRLLP